MKYLPLVWRNLLRRKVRTTFTLGSIFIAFVLYAFLMTLRSAFSMGVDIAGVDRLMMMHKVSLLQLLPLSYKRDILSTPGVKLASSSTWFGGTYQDKANQFAVIAVDPESYLDLYPEFKVPPEQVKAWIADRQGALVGRDVAARYGWKIGDKVPIQATIWQPKQGTAWFFNVDAIYDGDKSIDKTNLFFQYDYLNENRRGAYGQVGWYVIRIEDPSRAAEMAAKLDSQFANSSAETKTSTEKAFLQGFVNQIGDVSSIMVAILVAVLFSILLVTANTMAQAVRERTNELAVLKTLGFTDGLVVGLVLAESLFLALLGGGLGLAITWLLVSRGSFNNAFLPVFVMRGRDLAIGVVLCCLLGALAGALPATSAMRLRITDALRRN
ncbi:MAG TPA: FtsX-like permease family protein [Vicinamibacterales bacterium]|jgi:putative ABC transport system permease protein|nr:FtsX-like permease family protein [Vicinamibacterales bacterium]